MRICYYADGRYIHAERWMKFFLEHGHEMHLISFAEVSADRAAELEAMGIRYHGATGNFHIKKFWETLKDLRYVRSVLEREKIDILHCHFLGANCWYAALSGFHPYVITVMGGDVTGVHWKPDMNPQVRFLTPYALRNADHITAWSNALASTIRPYCGGTPIEVVHGGIHLEKFFPAEAPDSLFDRWNIPRGARVVFSPRLIRPLSNILEIARAANLVSDAMPDVYYLVASPVTAVDEGYARDVETTFASGAASDKVRFVSEISYDQIADYYRMADVTVSVTKSDGTPMTVLESMACGTPTVIGDLPDYDPEYFEHDKTTVMVDVNNARTIADGVLRILNDRGYADTLAAEAGRRIAKTGGYEYQMGRMEGIYRQLLGS